MRMAQSQPSMIRPVSTGPLAYVLDDEAQIRDVVCEQFESIGFTTRAFSDPAELYANIRSAVPDIVVLDLALGTHDAIEVMRCLEMLHYRGKVLLFSGHGEAALEESRRIGKRHGLSMLPPLPKPFQLADLKQRLDAPPGPEQSPDSKDSDGAVGGIDLDEALRNGRLELWYQPKVELKSMTVCGAEALLRLRHPDHGVLTPARFLPPTGSGLYHPLTSYVVQQAMAHLNYFAAQGHPLRLAINVPLMALQAPNFVDFVCRSLPQNSYFPGLTIEVTEGEVLPDPDKLREVAIRLRLHKVELSIDDFGAAHSSLARLRDIPAAELKLDHSYVTGCAFDSAKQAVCIATMELAHSFGLTACAEGVEDINDLRILLDLGYHQAQGFLFAKPMPAGKLVRMLSQRTQSGSRPGRSLAPIGTDGALEASRPAASQRRFWLFGSRAPAATGVASPPAISRLS
jgi:EAL domain-containing protein (putative c-di-GMP-specific phosphodiesterase class I)